MQRVDCLQRVFSRLNLTVCACNTCSAHWSSLHWRPRLLPRSCVARHVRYCAHLCCFVVCFPGVLHENDDVSSLSHRRVRHASLSDAAMASGRHFLLLITTDKYTNRTHGIGSYRLLCVLHVTFYVPHAVVASEWFYATLSTIRYDTIR